MNMKNADDPKSLLEDVYKKNRKNFVAKAMKFTENLLDAEDAFRRKIMRRGNNNT